MGVIAHMSKIRKPPGIRASVLTIRRFADSFDGLTIKEARRRFVRRKVQMTTWEYGKEMVATYPTHEVRLMFFGGKVQMTSVQILSK